jgi:hypothetical protein
MISTDGEWKIPDEEWNSIVTETRTRVDRMNKRAREKGESEFRVTVHHEKDYSLLVTERLTGGYREWIQRLKKCSCSLCCKTKGGAA